MLQRLVDNMTAKVALAVLLVETTVLFALGHYYVGRFSQEIDNRIQDRADLPGRLMDQGLLSYDFVEDSTALRRIVHEAVTDAMVIRRDMLVFYAPDKERAGRPVHQVLSPEVVRIMQPDMTVAHERSSEQGVSSLVVITPLRHDKKIAGYLYLKIDTSQSEAQKQAVAWLFAMGSILCIVLSSLAKVLVIHFLTSKRLRQTIQCLNAAQSGDLDTRLETPRSNDEIAVLQRNVNSLIEEIQVRTSDSDSAQRALTINEARFRGITENTSELTMVLDRDDNFSYCNPASTRTLGHIPEEVLGGSALRFVHTEDMKPFSSAIHAVKKTPGQSLSLMDLRLLTRNREVIHLEISITNLYDTPGVEGIVLHGREITERVIAEQKLRASEESLSITLDSIGDAVVATDERGLVRRMNPAAEDLCGWSQSEAIGLPLDCVCRVRELNASESTPNPADRTDGGSGDATQTSMILSDRAGREQRVAVSGTPILNHDAEIKGTVTVFRDITQQHESEARLLQSQKLEAVGELAGGVAHDFNNLLSGIMGYADILSDCIEGQGPHSSYPAEIIKIATRAAETVQQLLTFSRKAKIKTASLDIHTIIEEIVELLRTTIDPKTELKTELRATSDLITGDPGQIQNAILNLGVNARDAMPDGGVMTFSTCIIDVDPAIKASYDETLVSGEYLQVSVQDTGLGMTAEVQEKIFDPFFTTKDVGKGTGLGLPAVYGTAHAHGGSIEVTSGPGQGACFTLLLPLQAELQDAP